VTGSPTLRERLAAGETVVGTFAKLPGADAAELLAGAGFDFAIVDREHSQLSDGEARALVRTMRGAGLPALALLEVATADDDYPVGVTGKVLKRHLRERYSDLSRYVGESSARVLAAIDLSPVRAT
jgi:hypothetical protein